MAALLFASCTTDVQPDDLKGRGMSGYEVTLNASISNVGTRIRESFSETEGLVTDWNSDDSLDVLVNSNEVVPMTRNGKNSFSANVPDQNVAEGFKKGKTIHGVNNRHDDNITTVLNGNGLRTILDFTGQDGTIDNLAKYDLMYGTGDPTGNVTFSHKICVIRLQISSDSLKADGITSITGMKLKYVPTSGTSLFASSEVYNFGPECDSTITDADYICLNNTNITVTDGTASVYLAVPHRQTLNGKLYISLMGNIGSTSKIYNLSKPISLINKSFEMSTIHSKTLTSFSRTPVKAGYYLFSDGWWGSLSDNIGPAEPIAVIFSNTTSSTDQGYGWTHGYAMALKNASTSCKWGTSGTNPTGKYITTIKSITDKDGYTHTTFISSSSYPAANAAIKYQSTVAAPGNTSGWYLPGLGQLIDITVNLGGYSTSTDPSSTITSNINKFLTPLPSGTYDKFTYGSKATSYYWSSSEFNSDNVYVLFFNDVIKSTSGPKSNSKNLYVARSVLAF